MPKISIPIKNGYSSESVINMAETLGRLTGTAVECQATLEITANEQVIQALKAIAPMARGKYKKRQAVEIAQEDPDSYNPKP